MGHHLHAKSSLVPLIDRLNRYPVGLVDNEKLREILSLLFEEKEAFVASRFPMAETTLPELSQRTQMPPEQLLPVLDVMANKGLIVDMPFEGTTYYLLLPGLIGAPGQLNGPGRERRCLLVRPGGRPGQQ